MVSYNANQEIDTSIYITTRNTFQENNKRKNQWPVNQVITEVTTRRTPIHRQLETNEAAVSPSQFTTNADSKVSDRLDDC